MAREAATRPLLPCRPFPQGTGAPIVGFLLVNGAPFTPERFKSTLGNRQS
jgi:hypothetical protein